MWKNHKACIVLFYIKESMCPIYGAERICCMIKLLKEVREIKRKLSLPIKRRGDKGSLVPADFTERETNILIEMDITIIWTLFAALIIVAIGINELFEWFERRKQ
jgi:hypothetical protein